MAAIIVTKEQRREFVSLVSRLVFGRFATRTGRSRSNRESVTARRNAVLTFLFVSPRGENSQSNTFPDTSISDSCLTSPVEELGELSTFLHLVLRSILPSSLLLSLGNKELERSQLEFRQAPSRGAYYKARADKGDDGVPACESWYRLSWQLAENIFAKDLDYLGSSSNQGRALA